jgi:hypothetical protein
MSVIFKIFQVDWWNSMWFEREKKDPRSEDLSLIHNEIISQYYVNLLQYLLS